MTNNKPVKFDMAQKDSSYFKEYINKIIVEEEKKYAIPVKWGISTEWTADGQFKIAWYDNDGQVKCVGTAKCHPEDAFNPEIGVRLAITRAVKNMRKPFIPCNGQLYYFVCGNGLVVPSHFRGSIEDQLRMAMGNCFKTKAQAQVNVDIITKRAKRATELLKMLRDE